MSLTAGIVGLPNVGKSTLFNAITKKNILAANYPFATIDPNVGVVVVPDKRLAKLEEMVTPENVVPTSFEFIDIAGLVKGASKGEGLGNQFLGNIRNCDAILEQVLNCEGPCVCEAVVDPTQNFAPKSSSKVLPDGIITSPSLDDMAPFLDRDEFNKIRFIK